jgi:hypothetical protein
MQKTLRSEIQPLPRPLQANSTKSPPLPLVSHSRFRITVRQGLKLTLFENSKRNQIQKFTNFANCALTPAVRRLDRTYKYMGQSIVSRQNIVIYKVCV